MAIHRPSIMGFSIVPDLTGDVFFEPLSAKAANDEWRRLVGVFNDTSTRLALHLGFIVPENFATQPKFVVDWASSAVTGDVRWEVDYRVVEPGENLDQVGVEETVGATVTVPATAFDLERTELLPTATNFARGAEVELRLVRDGADAADTAAAAALLLDLLFAYSDT